MPTTAGNVATDAYASPMVNRSPEEAMRQAMEEWKDFHNRECKRLANRLQAAIPRNVSPLCYIGGYNHEPWSRPDPAGLVAEMKKIINHTDFARPARAGSLRCGMPTHAFFGRRSSSTP